MLEEMMGKSGVYLALKLFLCVHKKRPLVAHLTVEVFYPTYTWLQ
jgi:hypothetical protein